MGLGAYGSCDQEREKALGRRSYASYGMSESQAKEYLRFLNDGKTSMKRKVSLEKLNLQAVRMLTELSSTPATVLHPAGQHVVPVYDHVGGVVS